MNIDDDEIIKTKSINDALQVYANKNSLSLDECDFKIIQVETSVKDYLATKFQVLNIDINQEYKDKSKLINEHTGFMQHYYIKIFRSSTEIVKLNYTLDYSEFLTHPKIILSPDSIIPYKTLKPQEVFNILIQEINKIKAKHRFLLNIFDENMIKNLKAFTKYLYNGKFTKRVKISLFEGVKPEVTKKSSLIFHFQEEENESQIIEVSQNEVLVEFIKPIFGSSGFNAYGEEVSIAYVTNSDDLSTYIDEKSIDIVEDKYKKIYKSKLKGYVHYDENSFYIDNKVKVSKLSRNQDMLASEEQNNIEVIVSQNDTTKDSVGEGVELTSETIHINGHVGAHSIIEATNLKIDGATHQDSSQFAKFAAINRHKGKLRCHEATIKLLEGGEVHATKVDIETALGGTIYAQDVSIQHVKNNLRVYASNSITIKLVRGEDNLFKINYKEIPILNSKIHLIEDDINELKFTLEEATRHDISKVPFIKEEIQNFKNEKLSIINSTKSAKISISEPVRGLNTITFTIDDENELTFKTEAKNYDDFYLEINEDIITLLPVNKSITL